MSKYNHDDPGYIYIMSNESMPGLVKVGVTTRCVVGRAAELYTTGVPTPFKVEFSLFTEHCHEKEVYAHEELEPERVNGSREFFKIYLGDAITRVSNAVIGESTGLVLEDHRLWVDPSVYHCLARDLRDRGYSKIGNFELDYYMIAGMIGYMTADELIPAFKKFRAASEERQREYTEKREVALSVV